MTVDDAGNVYVADASRVQEFDRDGNFVARIGTTGFGADQVMYNHFGYRTPVERLYMAGSACHPGGAISGGAGYISAGIIARDLGLKPWWKPWDAGEALRALPAAAA